MQWYYNALANRPSLIIIFITVFCTACIIVSLTLRKLPDFSDPTLGFETRGTSFGKRRVAWQNLIDSTGPSALLAADPTDLTQRSMSNTFDRNNFPTVPRHTPKKHRKGKNQQTHKEHRNNSRQTKDRLQKINYQAQGKSNNKTNETEKIQSNFLPEWDGGIGVLKNYEITNDTVPAANVAQEIFGFNLTTIDEDTYLKEVQTEKDKWTMLQNTSFIDVSYSKRISSVGYFCASPQKGYSHFVVQRRGVNATDSMFDLNGILALCEMEEEITSVHNYNQYCEVDVVTKNCCRPWSLASYATFFANKSSCFDITKEDVLALKNLLLDCYEYFYDLRLSYDCHESKCYAPQECTRNNMVFDILHYLTDYNIIKINDTNIFLKYAMIFVPTPHSHKIMPLYYEWRKADLSNEFVQVVAMDLGLENDLFNALLMKDVWLVGLGGVFVMTCMWLYTTSIFITLMTCIAVIFSLGLAYFVYTIVLEMSFFPYMNLLAIVVIIGIGADNAFLYVKLWHCVLNDLHSNTSTVTMKSLTNVETERSQTLQTVIERTIDHAISSIIVSSATTAVAFFASYTSHITAIKCFGVFAGCAVISNFLLMVTWLPAVISMSERFPTIAAIARFRVHKMFMMLNKSINMSCKILVYGITNVVLNYASILLLVLGALGIGCGVIVLYKPGLQLPVNSHFQLFVSSHPFEVYNAQFKQQFWFEKTTPFQNSDNYKMPLRFVWGIQPVDDGNYANPSNYGNLHFDNNFRVSTKAAQIWLLNFCSNLRKQPFYQDSFGILLNNCFIENFRAIMQRMCINEMDYSNRAPCCDVSKFPYKPLIFDYCLPQIMSSLYATPREYFWPGDAGPKFMAPKIDPNVTFEYELDNSSPDPVLPNNTAPPPIVKAVVIEFESNVSYSMLFGKVKHFVDDVELWFKDQLKSAPQEMKNGWFISELKFYDVQSYLSSGTIVAIIVAMAASLTVLLLFTKNILVSLFAVITVLFSIFVTVAILIMLGWKLNILESVAMSTAIGLAVDYSLHYGIHYRLSPSSERLASTRYALSRIIGPTAMAAVTTGMAGFLMIFSSLLPYRQIGIFLVVVMAVSWVFSTFFLMSLLSLIGPQYGFMQFRFPSMTRNKRENNALNFYERQQNNIAAREQLLTPSSSAVGDLINSESHELESLTSNSQIKTISGTECSGPSYSLDYDPVQRSKLLITSTKTAKTAGSNHHVRYSKTSDAQTAIITITTMPNISVTSADCESNTVETTCDIHSETNVDES